MDIDVEESAENRKQLSHLPDELIVDLNHLDVVLSMLADLGVSHAGEIVEHQVLGLARVWQLKDPSGTKMEVDDILGRLRQQAAADRDGWVPTIGKNRVVDLIVNSGTKTMHGLTEGPGTLPGRLPGRVEEQDVPPVEAPPDAGQGVRVGMVDGPVHPGSPAETLPFPYRSGHGLFVRSLISRQAPAAQIELMEVLDSTTGRAGAWDVAEAIVALAFDMNVDILNLSLGGFTLAGGPPLIISRAIERVSRSVLVVAAAGNHGALVELNGDHTARSASWPAAIPPVIAVGADAAPGVRAEFSPDLPWVRCAAPGVNVVGDYLLGEVDLDGETALFTGHARWSGTSFSAATVTGAIAARTVPGKISPVEAFRTLLAERGLVRDLDQRP